MQLCCRDKVNERLQYLILQPLPHWRELSVWNVQMQANKHILQALPASMSRLGLNT